jgi:Ca2+-binding RTX toxin-like protein
LNYGVSINNDAVKDKVIMTLNKFSFSDSSISINAKGVIDGDAVSNGNLKVTTANFSLNTKVLLASTFENMLLAGEYGDKATFEDVFGITTEFQGTDDADVIKINTVKTTVTKAPSRLDTTDLIQLTLSVDAKGGNDTITGSAGADSITGGEGNDVFVIGNKDSGSITITSTVTTTNVDGTTIEYEAEAINSDTITDFKGSEIDDSEKVTKGDVLSLGVAGSAANYDEATEAVGDFSAALTSANDALSKLTAKGERFAFQFDEESGYLFNDVNGDGKADQVIILTGVTNEGIAAIDIVK